MTTKGKQGFASMDPDKVRECASMGGKAATNRHRWTAEEAQVAGRKGQQGRRARKLTEGGTIGEY